MSVSACPPFQEQRLSVPTYLPPPPPPRDGASLADKRQAANRIKSILNGLALFGGPDLLRFRALIRRHQVFQGLSLQAPGDGLLDVGDDRRLHRRLAADSSPPRARATRSRISLRPMVSIARAER